MNKAKEFLQSKEISIHSVEATRLPHKFKSIEYELIPLMEEYAIQKQIDLLDNMREHFFNKLTPVNNTTTGLNYSIGYINKEITRLEELKKAIDKI